MTESKENILSCIGGTYVADALKMLPPCETAADDMQECIFEHPRLGRVRFTCQRMTGRSGKHRYKFWTAIAAIKID